MGNECMYCFISSKAFFDVHECIENCACNSKNNSFLLVMIAKQEPKLSFKLNNINVNLRFFL
jgi:hypothetical protein